ncbi:MerR family transcriptional regulator [Phycicoccus sp. BSK3Z-2]|uniref:MerR family transcriptional regulator n=1 Tax=Phycicoccus avicenniae TaxID=2828860 RepID=A0A941HYW2_9MICO|nr:MerR family transcriptional regulator [Phycicoccus avicenniae]MBR7742280.1 MerR family transcriptional regulator [Phycicoccus avicenniae]
MDDTETLMSIGEFSARTRLSVRMLRHYDEHDVLAPAAVDPRTGYRAYAPAQVAEALHVRRLRDVGFTVSAIVAVRAAAGTPAYAEALAAQRAALEEEAAAARGRLALIDRLISDEGHPMTDITVTRTTVPARRVVALRGVVPTYSDEGALWGRMMPELQAQGIVPTGPGGCIEHVPEYVEHDVDESVWLPVAPGTEATAPLEALDLPAQDVVVARVVGPYELISEAHARIQELCAAEGLRPAATSADDPVEAKVFNRYLTDPSGTAPEDLVTEVCVPVA